MKKVLLIANAKYTLTHFRGELIEELQKRGHSVKMAVPLGKDLDGSQVSAKEVLPIRMDRKGINPKNDLKLIWDLIRLVRSEKPDVVINFTIKPVIYGSLVAGFFSRAKIFSNITGLGYVFTDTSAKAGIIKKIVIILYRLALKRNEKVFFQNPDDIKLFSQIGVLPPDKAKLINGSGIAIEKFASLSAPTKQSQSFLFVGRLLKDKGLKELVEAFKIVKKKFPNAVLTVVGEGDDNPNSFDPNQIENWKVQEKSILFLGRVNDVKPYLRSHQVMVLPSYREGTPRSVLEAMASGMPIITTDVPGCRETVENGKNGFLVPAREHGLLAEKMLYFLLNPEQIKKMGEQSLILVKNKFDVKNVNAEILKTLDIG
jgi:glycosyltransferase involved in cell wall biosynthesis